MAASQHIHFSATLVDSAQIKAQKTSQLFIDPAQTVTQLQTALGTWLTDLDLLTDSVITRASIGIPRASLAGLKTTPTAGAENQETVTIAFDQASLSTHYGDNIPAYIQTGLVGDKVDLTNANFVAWVALLTGATLGGGYSGLGNELLTALYRAFQGDRKHRRQLFAKSVTYP